MGPDGVQHCQDHEHLCTLGQKTPGRYRHTGAGKIIYHAPMDLPKNDFPRCREHHAVLATRTRDHLGVVRLRGIIKIGIGIDVPCSAIHKMLRDKNLAPENQKKSRRRKWVRFERTHSNSMWHTDYKLLEDGRWLLCYKDDASRFVTGYGIFEHATTENTLTVLDEAIKNHGKPAAWGDPAQAVGIQGDNDTQE